MDRVCNVLRRKRTTKKLDQKRLKCWIHIIKKGGLENSTLTRYVEGKRKAVINPLEKFEHIYKGTSIIKKKRGCKKNKVRGIKNRMLW